MVICLECGRSFAFITNTHLRNHDLTPSGYLEKYPGAEIHSADHLEKLKNRPIRRGWNHTERSKQMMSDGLKGRVAWNRGVAMSEEQKSLLSERAKERAPTRTGAVLDQTTKDKISAALRGRSLSKETKEKISNANKNRPSSMAGKRHTEGTRKKLSNQLRLRWQRRRGELDQKTLDMINSLNLDLVGTLGENLEMKCRICRTVFNRSRQMLDPCRLREDFCPGCRPEPAKHSKAEYEIAAWIRELIPEQTVRVGDRLVIYPLELDIVVPDSKLAIEYCGLYWHSELAGKFRDYHLNKLNLCQQHGYRLITVFESEWMTRPTIVQARIAHALGKTGSRIGARETVVRKIDPDTAGEFLRSHHIQGNGRSNCRYGLYHRDVLVSVMTFAKTTIAKGGDGSHWEISRFASDRLVIGGASRLFKAFLDEYDPDAVISYADRRYGDGDLYSMLGFERVGETPPNYWYFRTNSFELKHRFGLRKTQTDIPELTEWENRRAQGWNRIWDCGSVKFLYTKKRNGPG